MTVLVFGRTGQVATELARLGGDQVICLGRDRADLSDPAACAALITATDARAVINAAAWTAVDGAETHEAEARIVNADAPAAMARAAADRGLPFVHLSTDYVFAGTGTAPWTPDDPAAPQNAYGRTKLAGEVGVRDAGGPHAILRTSWVVSAHGANFVTTMLRLAGERDALRIVADQIGGPTPAADLARIALVVADRLQVDPTKSGTYHVAGGPDVSWADFARAIFDLSGQAIAVTDIASRDFPTPAQRPLNSRLDCTSLTDCFGIARHDWHAGLRDILRDLGALRQP